MSLTGPQVPDGLQNTLAMAAEPAAKKKRMQRAHGGKQGDKGLRHFSMKVCEKVEQKGRTTYNEVADELVAEFGAHAQLRAPRFMPLMHWVYTRALSAHPELAPTASTSAPRSFGRQRGRRLDFGPAI